MIHSIITWLTLLTVYFFFFVFPSPHLHHLDRVTVFLQSLLIHIYLSFQIEENSDLDIHSVFGWQISGYLKCLLANKSMSCEQF